MAIAMEPAKGRLDSQVNPTKQIKTGVKSMSNRKSMSEKLLERRARKVLALILENKGGAGKSTIAQIVVETLKLNDEKVHVIETDTSNSSMSATGLATGAVASTREEGFEGALIEAIRMIEHKKVDHAVVDCGARDEADVMPLIPELARDMTRIGGKLIVFRPITTNHFIQNNATESAKKLRGTDAGVVFVTNISCGRRPEHFRRWYGTKTFASLTEAGVVSMEIGDAGPVLADNAVSLGLSFGDVAMGNLDKAGKYEELARQLFDDRLQYATASWLGRSTTAMAEAIERCCTEGWK